MDIILGIYGLLMLAGGVIGYKKAGSKMSLIMGIVSSVFIFIGLYLTQASPAKGYTLIAVMAVFLLGVFIKRFIKTKSFMPSGMLVIVNLLALVICLLKLQ